MEKLYLIGKSVSCDIVLSQSTVSRQHAQLIVYSDRVEIVDLNSTNGTFVNGSQIKQPYVLNKGDVLVLGGELFHWEQYTFNIDTEEPNHKQAPIEQNQKSRAFRFTVIGVLILIISVPSIILLNSYNEIIGNSENNSSLNRDNKNLDENQKNDADDKIEPGEVQYDFSCLSEKDETPTTDVINVLSDIEGGVIDAFGEEVTLDEEIKLGEDLLEEIQVSDNGINYNRISKICRKLVQAIPNKKGYNYAIHYVEEDVLNAFTAGGQIFVYQGMIDFCKNDDELAAIIAHEIAHNELGHIKRKISEIKTMEKIGGALTAEIFMAATISFGQKMETHCDLYGVDLSIKAGFNGCEVVNVWKRMEDSEFNSTEAMIRSHPFSEQRADCCQNHINKHHYNKCK